MVLERPVLRLAVRLDLLLHFMRKITVSWTRRTDAWRLRLSACQKYTLYDDDWLNCRTRRTRDHFRLKERAQDDADVNDKWLVLGACFCTYRHICRVNVYDRCSYRTEHDIQTDYTNVSQTNPRNKCGPHKLTFVIHCLCCCLCISMHSCMVHTTMSKTARGEDPGLLRPIGSGLRTGTIYDRSVKC